jgi:hypothetical protein
LIERLLGIGQAIPLVPTDVFAKIVQAGQERLYLCHGEFTERSLHSNAQSFDCQGIHPLLGTFFWEDKDRFFPPQCLAH